MRPTKLPLLKPANQVIICGKSKFLVKECRRKFGTKFFLVDVQAGMGD
jgi:hypothetical protein